VSAHDWSFKIVMYFYELKYIKNKHNRKIVGSTTAIFIFK
jgi:hypothetical protein